MTWLPLADHDPVPGDPCSVEDLSSYFTDRAGGLRAIAAELHRLDTGSFWEGDAAQAFAERRGRFLPHVEAVATRWDVGGRALATWAGTMRESQTKARTALAMARTAVEQRAEAQRQLDTARQDFTAHIPEAVMSPTTVSPWSDLEAIRFWEGQIAEREGDLACARGLLAQAEELYDHGARTCAAALDSASDDSIEDDHGLLARARRTTHGIVRRFPQIKTIAKYVGLAAGALAIAASMFTGVGALATLAFIAGGGATLLDTALLVSGDGDLATVTMDVVGLITFGSSRLLASAARDTAARTLVEEAQTMSHVTHVKEITAQGVRSVPLTAAARSERMATVYRQWSGFMSDTSMGAYPDGRNWLRALTSWREIKIPPPEVLNVSREAARYATASKLTEAIGTLNDVWGVVSTEVEMLDD